VNRSIGVGAGRAKRARSRWNVIQSHLIVILPSTTISVPVMKRASSDAGNSATFDVIEPRHWRTDLGTA